MAQIINAQPTWQEALGSGLGKGIQTGVTSLIEQKLQQMGEERQMSQRGKAIEGLAKSGFLGKDVTPESLEALKYLDPTTLNTILKEQLRAPQNEAFAKYLGGISTGEEGEIPKGLTGQQAYQAAKLKQQSQLIKQGQEEKGYAASEKYRSALAEEVKSGDIMKAELNQLEGLIKNSDVASGVWGLLPNAFQNQATQQAQELINKMAIPLEAKAKANSDKRLQAVLNSLVQLTGTPGAQLANIDHWKKLIDLNKIEDEAQEAIIKEKGYVRNLQQEAYKRAAPQREKILSSIEKDINAKATDWIPGDDMPASRYTGKERISEDGTIEYSDGKKWIKGRNPKGVVVT